MLSTGLELLSCRDKRVPKTSRLFSILLAGILMRSLRSQKAVATGTKDALTALNSMDAAITTPDDTLSKDIAGGIKSVTGLKDGGEGVLAAEVRFHYLHPKLSTITLFQGSVIRGSWST